MWPEHAADDVPRLGGLDGGEPPLFACTFARVASVRFASAANFFVCVRLSVWSRSCRFALALKRGSFSNQW